MSGEHKGRRVGWYKVKGHEGTRLSGWEGAKARGWEDTGACTLSPYIPHALVSLMALQHFYTCATHAPSCPVIVLFCLPALMPSEPEIFCP